MSGHQICFAASDELVSAIDKEAFRNDEPRSAAIRRVLADYLREVGILRPTDPTTHHQGQVNPFFRPRRGKL